jgi:hypothetical protein
MIKIQDKINSFEIKTVVEKTQWDYLYAKIYEKVIEDISEKITKEFLRRNLYSINKDIKNHFNINQVLDNINTTLSKAFISALNKELGG